MSAWGTISKIRRGTDGVPYTCGHHNERSLWRHLFTLHRKHEPPAFEPDQSLLVQPANGSLRCNRAAWLSITRAPMTATNSMSVRRDSPHPHDHISWRWICGAGEIAAHRRRSIVSGRTGKNNMEPTQILKGGLLSVTEITDASGQVCLLPVSRSQCRLCFPLDPVATMRKRVCATSMLTRISIVETLLVLVSPSSRRLALLHAGHDLFDPCRHSPSPGLQP